MTPGNNHPPGDDGAPRKRDNAPPACANLLKTICRSALSVMKIYFHNHRTATATTTATPRPLRALRLYFSYLFFFLLSVFWLPASAFAACSSPAGNAGDLMYNQASHVPQYCDGSLWWQMGNKGVGGGGGCASPAGSEGDVMYNAASHAMQFCDSALWRQIGATGAGQAITTSTSSSNPITPDVPSPAVSSGAMTNGLVGWWKLDDASSGNAVTTAADSSGGAHNGTTQGSVKPTWTASGQVKNALILAAASSQYVSVPAAAALALSTWTVSGWIYMTALPAHGGGTADGYTLVAKQGGVNNEDYDLMVDNGAFGCAASCFMIEFATSSAADLRNFLHTDRRRPHQHLVSPGRDMGRHKPGPVCERHFSRHQSARQSSG